VSENGSEAEDAKRDGQEREDFRKLLQSAGKENRSKEDGVNTCGLSVLNRHADWFLGFLLFLLFFWGWCVFLILS